MKLTWLKIVNSQRLQDLEIRVREHLVIVGANDVGKSSLLRLLNLTFACTVGQLYQSLSRADLRDPMRPLIVEAAFAELTGEERRLFYREIDIDPEDQTTATLKIRLDVEPVDGDPEAITIRRWLPGTAEGRAPTRDQIAALGWRYLSANRTAGASLLDGPNSALRTLLDAIDMGPEAHQLTGLLDDFNEKLGVSERLGELRGTVADHLSKAMPQTVTADDLAIRTQSDPAASVLAGVSMFFSRNGQYVPLIEQSDGMRQLVAMTLFDLAEAGANIVAVDEPELHLQPSNQRNVATLFASGANQKIVATHSAYVLQCFEPAHVLVIAPDGSAHQLNENRFDTIEKLRLQWWSPHLLEALTARYVIAVEGISDRRIVQRAARVLGIDLDRIGAMVFTLDGADKFRHVYALLGKNGFGVCVLGLVDEAEKGIFCGAYGGKQSIVLGDRVWACQIDLEHEYCTALTATGMNELLVAAKVCREGALREASGVAGDDDLTIEGIARFCRNNKTAAAEAVSASLTAEQVTRMPAVKGILEKVRELAAR
ncbi:ATP-dependent endonuclease [Embleya sp. NPDC059237]|uniref:ATP-dependent nuclease n=1 Tax=unclassified Embleya TaxID=2699296 RepID=UPI003684A6D8